MKNKILILRNVKRENPGIIETVLNELEIPFDIIDFIHGDRTPPLENYSALIVLGGPDSANDQTSKMLSELAFIKKAVDAGMPYLGICLGLQTFVKAMGGSVEKCRVPETGFRDTSDSLFTIKLTPEGRKDHLFRNLPGEINVFQLHGETVGLSSGMTLLAEGENCRNQVVKYGERAYGFQCHFELDENLLSIWMKEDEDLKKTDPEKLGADFNSLKTKYTETGRKIIINFLEIAGLIRLQVNY